MLTLQAGLANATDPVTLNFKSTYSADAGLIFSVRQIKMVNVPVLFSQSWPVVCSSDATCKGLTS